MYRPAKSESFLSNFGTNERLAYIIDLLGGVAGVIGNILNFHDASAAAANQDAKNQVNAPCVLAGYEMLNTAAYPVYVKFYDKANPTSADTPVRRVSLPAGGGISRASIGFGFLIQMSTRCTKGLADNDATACLAGDVVFSVDYTLS